MDLYFTEQGDIARSHTGDIAMTPTPWRDDVQQAYIRVMTEQGDYRLFPDLGASLSLLYGMPQSPETGSFGEQLIVDALNREARFSGQSFKVKAVPTGPQTIRFDIDLISGDREARGVAVEQDLIENLSEPEF